ncbi:hypothetical protein IGJ00_002720 [Enterococcus sp. AZ062]
MKKKITILVLGSVCYYPRCLQVVLHVKKNLLMSQM